MLLQDGHWLGRGSLLAEGQTLGQGVSCDVDVSHDEDGFTIAAEVDIKEVGARALSVRVAANDVGTYSINVRTLAETFSGTAKLDSPPNLGLLWNEAGTTYVTFALFEVSAGYGFRGFLRDGKNTYTWEIAFSLKQNVVSGDNVVSLANRRKR
ncbi:MAG: hypothetical protein OES38_16595 [Gammaproteobacteria bacterium]|nr:hypothetical protein [Gammaproteobacteria bacterium]